MKFRKKPIVIEAEQFWSDKFPLPFQTEGVCQYGVPFNSLSGTMSWYVRTLEGPLYISEGDWIIRDIQGEYYPCKPDVFERTYEPVAFED